jgi:hypothetical protein
MLTESFKASRAYEEMREALAGVRTQMGSLSFAMPSDVAALGAMVERVLQAVTTAHQALERQMQAERDARAAAEAEWKTRLEQASDAVLDAERRIAEVAALLAASDSSLSAERAARERAESRPQAAPKPEPADFKLKFTRGQDGKIDGDSVVIQRIPRK